MMLARTKQGGVTRHRLVNTDSTSAAMRTIERYFPKEEFRGAVQVRRGVVGDVRSSRMGSGNTVTMVTESKVGIEGKKMMDYLKDHKGSGVYYHVGQMSGRIEKCFLADDVLTPKGS